MEPARRETGTPSPPLLARHNQGLVISFISDLTSEQINRRNTAVTFISPNITTYQRKSATIDY